MPDNRVTTVNVNINNDLLNAFLRECAERKLPATEAIAHLLFLAAAIWKLEVTNAKMDPRAADAKSSFLDSARRSWNNCPHDYMKPPPVEKA